MIEILKKIPFFAELPDEDLEAIGKQVQMQYFGADQVIFEQGDYGEEMWRLFMVLSSELVRV